MKIANYLIVSYAFPPTVSVQTMRVSKLVKYSKEFDLVPFALSVKRCSYEKRDNLAYWDIENLLGGCIRTHSIEPATLKWIIKYILGRLEPPLDQVDANPSFFAKEEFTFKPEPWIKTALLPKKSNKLLKLILPDQYRGWQFTAVKAGIKTVRENGINFIYSNGFPYSAHFIAEKIQDVTGIPWFMDFRDGWIEDTDLFNPISAWHRKRELAACRRMLEKASQVFFITPGITSRYSKRFGHLRHKFHTIIQGYDGTIEVPRRDNRNDRLTITYTGSFFAPTYTPRSILAAAKYLKENAQRVYNELRIRFVGNVEMVKSYLHEYDVDEVIEMTPLIPYRKALIKMAESDVLLVIYDNTEWNKIRIGTKTFDYIRMNIPILAIVPEDSDVAHIIRKTKTGNIVNPTQIRKLAHQILEYHSQWKLNRLKIFPDINQISHFDSRISIGKLLTIMRDEING